MIYCIAYRSCITTQHTLGVVQTMAAFSKGGTTSPDFYIGVTSIILIVLCTLLNSVMLRHNILKRSSIPRTLYIILSFMDLLSCWVLLLPYTIHVLKECRQEDKDICGTDEYKMKIIKSGAGNKLYAIFGWMFSLGPANVTAFLAMTRLIQIKYPFRRLQVKNIVAALTLSIVWIPTVVTTGLLDIREDNPGCATPIHFNVIAQSWVFCPHVLGIKTTSTGFFVTISCMTILLQVGAILASVFTVHELIKVHLNPVSKGSKKSGEKSKSCLKIVVTNMGSVVLLILSIIVTLKTSQTDTNKGMEIGDATFYMTVNIFIPALISTFNPIIYILLTPGSINFKVNPHLLRQSTSNTVRIRTIPKQ